MNDMCVLRLQNFMDLQGIHGSGSETCDAIQITRIKVEVSDTEEGEYLVPLKYSGIKPEHVVSCMSVCHC
jgi:hypothetical protein